MQTFGIEPFCCNAAKKHPLLEFYVWIDLLEIKTVKQIQVGFDE